MSDADEGQEMRNMSIAIHATLCAAQQMYQFHFSFILSAPTTSKHIAFQVHQQLSSRSANDPPGIAMWLHLPFNELEWI